MIKKKLSSKGKSTKKPELHPPDHSASPSMDELINLSKPIVLNLLNQWLLLEEKDRLDNVISSFRTAIEAPEAHSDWTDILNGTGESATLNREVLLAELRQILDSRTLERARYYLRRLERGMKEIKTVPINDINLARWKEYEYVLTDSLWVLPRRDTSGVHLGWYWGNFIPQIPHQMMTRYTKKGEWVLDAFAGSGTTLIEARRLGRNSIGIELNPKVVRHARELVEQEQNRYGVITKIVKGDSRTYQLGKIMKANGTEKIQLLIMHPPYHDIIRFSDNKGDLSNAESSDRFLEMFIDVVDNISPFLERGRYFALVIGDKFSDGEWIPLGFQCMNEVLKKGFTLKSIIVKNFDETRAKRDQKQLWRYRALAGGFYLFKHEYIFVFRKK